jgi:hypothetical protein
MNYVAKIDELLCEAQNMEAKVFNQELEGDLSGLYVQPSHAILLSTNLCRYQELSTFAHELSHAHHHHIPTINPKEHEYRELHADEEAARRLLTAQEVARAEALVGPHSGALAEELGVTVDIVEGFKRAYSYGRPWACQLS